MYIGIDIGARKIKTMLVSEDGQILVQFEKAIHYDYQKHQNDIYLHEQNPQEWIDIVEEAIHYSINKIPPAKKLLKEICIVGTSGTIIPCGKYGAYLYPAIMHDDTRARAEAERLNELGQDFLETQNYRFDSSFALPKIYWLKQNAYEIYSKTHVFCHISDFIVGRLSGAYNISDHSNALKTGYDLVNDRWPAFIERDLGISQAKLPVIIPPGELIASLSQEQMKEFGFSRPVAVITGCTASTAALLASGARFAGDSYLSIGDSMVFKMVTANRPHDAMQRIYCHKHPNGNWLPGGTSRVGANWITTRFSTDLDEISRLDRKSQKHIPTKLLVYPQVNGELFPFKIPDFHGFEPERYKSDLEMYAAHLEGTAYVARLGFEVLQEITQEKVKNVYILGGGTNSEEWMQILCNILNRPLLIVKYGDAAYGATLLSAGLGTYRQSLDTAMEQWIQIEDVYEPEPKIASIYEDLYQKFKSKTYSLIE